MIARRILAGLRAVDAVDWAILGILLGAIALAIHDVVVEHNMAMAGVALMFGAVVVVFVMALAWRAEEP